MAAISLVFFLGVAAYFSPIAIPCKVCIPVALLAIPAIFHLPFIFFLALILSALGDYFGAVHSFPGQMGAFALAHLAYILYFITQKVLHGTEIKGHLTYIRAMTFVVVCLFIIVCCCIIPNVKETFLQVGIGIYALLILTMLRCAMMQKDKCFMAGAILFVFSDFILAWNKFVGHVPNAWLLIMIPYYLGQWLLCLGAMRTKVRIQNSIE